MSNSNNTSGGIGLASLVFIVFLTLKLAEVGSVATWSWWWVTSPLWIPFVVMLVLVTLWAALKLIVWGVDSVVAWSRRRSRLRSMMDD